VHRNFDYIIVFFNKKCIPVHTVLNPGKERQLRKSFLYKFAKGGGEGSLFCVLFSLRGFLKSFFFT
jgi:hypothetical protein